MLGPALVVSTRSQAIVQAHDVLRGVQYEAERVELATFFETVADGSTPCAFGPAEVCTLCLLYVAPDIGSQVLTALSAGAVRRIVVWDGLDAPLPGDAGMVPGSAIVTDGCG
jgi:hypothetical protein